MSVKAFAKIKLSVTCAGRTFKKEATIGEDMAVTTGAWLTIGMAIDRATQEILLDIFKREKLK